MNHPKLEELAEYLYDELQPEQRAAVAQHVATCSECAKQLDAWRDVRKELGGWLVPLARQPVRQQAALAQSIRWAAAAIVLLCVGYGTARLSAPSVDAARLHADLAKELRSEVRQELASEMARYSDQQLAQQADFQQSVAATINGLAAQQVAQHATLRKDVETVAIRTQEEFNRIAVLEHANPGIDR